MYYLILAIIGIIGFILGKKLAQFLAFKKTNHLNSLSKTERQDMSEKSQEAIEE